MSYARDHLGRPIVAVTGIGVVTSLGQGKADNWSALTSGRSGIHSITRFPVDHMRTTIAGTVDFLASSGQGMVPLTYELAETAALEALSEAGFGDDFGGPLFLASPPVELPWNDRFEVYRSGNEGEGYARLLAAAARAGKASIFESVQFGSVADRLADRFGTRGMPVTTSTSGAAGSESAAGRSSRAVTCSARRRPRRNSR